MLSKCLIIVKQMVYWIFAPYETKSFSFCLLGAVNFHWCKKLAEWLPFIWLCYSICGNKFLWLFWMKVAQALIELSLRVGKLGCRDMKGGYIWDSYSWYLWNDDHICIVERNGYLVLVFLKFAFSWICLVVVLNPI